MTRFNKIVENVFIPADDAEVNMRKKDYKKNEMKENVYAERIFSEKHGGPINSGDIIVAQVLKYEDGEPCYYFVTYPGFSRNTDSIVYYTNVDEEYQELYGPYVKFFRLEYPRNEKRSLFANYQYSHTVDYKELNNDLIFKDLRIIRENSSEFMDIIGIKLDNTLKENVFIPADEDDILERQKIQAEDDKANVTSLYGEIKLGDMILVRNLDFAANYPKTEKFEIISIEKDVTKNRLDGFGDTITKFFPYIINVESSYYNLIDEWTYADLMPDENEHISVIHKGI